MVTPNPARRYEAVQRTFDAQLNAILQRTADDIAARIARLPIGVGGDIRRAQFQLVLNEIRTVQQSMWVNDITGVIRQGRIAAAKAAEAAMETLERVLYASLPERVAQAVSGGLKATAQAGIERDLARIPRTLSARVYHDFSITSGAVEKTIRSGIISGLSARELAADVKRFIVPTTPGGPSYAATRLARTEINNSFHNQQRAGGQRPGVKAVVWNLSGSHKRPDDCNTFAGQDGDGLGKGKYKSENVPNKPHPQCLCFLTYDMMDPDEFAAAIQNGQFDSELKRLTGENLATLGLR